MYIFTMIKRLCSFFMSLSIAIFGLIFPDDPARNAEEFVAAMTLEQKVGQMIMPAFRKWNGIDVTTLSPELRAAVTQYGFGGFILFGENCAGTMQTAKLVYDLQQTSINGSAGIPMLMGIDQEGGDIRRLATGTSTCGNMALGALNNAALTEQSAGIIASELESLRINTNFGPVLDVNSNPNNPVIGVRSFSSSPEIVASMGAAYIKGMHNHNICTALKHFPGHGDTATDSHTGLPCVQKTYDQIKQAELVPFAAGIKAGAEMIMTAHIEYPLIETTPYKSTSGADITLPATLSKKIITDILRNDMGFKGLVITDALNMSAIASNFTPYDAAKLAINAGVDILLMPVEISSAIGIAEMGRYIDAIVAGIKNGDISESNVNAAVSRIIKLKFDKGLNKPDSMTDSSRAADARTETGSLANHKLELEIAEKATTLVKNDNKLLPLDEETAAGALLFYPYDSDANSFEFAVNHMKKNGKLSEDFTLSAYSYRNASAADFGNKVADASVIIICTETFSRNYMLTANKNGWQAVFTDDMIALAHRNGKKVVLLSCQLPYDAARYKNADAILLTYCAKDMPEIPDKYIGEVKTYGVNIPAAVCVAFGDASPAGKSPVDIPELDGNFNYTDTILYSVGYGLSY